MKQSRPSRRRHRGSLNKQWPHDAAHRREFSAIIMKNHSQDTSQIWISLFISLECSAAKTSPNLAESIVILPSGPGEELQVPCRIQCSQEHIGSEGAFIQSSWFFARPACKWHTENNFNLHVLRGQFLNLWRYGTAQSCWHLIAGTPCSRYQSHHSHLPG